MLNKSRPVWGAWIEMLALNENAMAGQSRAPYGAR